MVHCDCEANRISKEFLLGKGDKENKPVPFRDFLFFVSHFEEVVSRKVTLIPQLERSSIANHSEIHTLAVLSVKPGHSAGHRTHTN